MTSLINDPNASRMIYGLRDTGYNVKTAAADIIDNSIAAGADSVKIDIQLLHDGRKLVYFGDNGCGMDQKEVHMLGALASLGLDSKRLLVPSANDTA
jgi:HSP90 family molecular chaperone